MAKKKKCSYCGNVFIPDPRVGNRQKACSKECQKLRKKENNMTLSNPEYWHVDYVKEWREKILIIKISGGRRENS